MRIPLILLTLGLLSFNACAVEPPSTEPFAKRYDPHSITTAARAREVIAAYDNEKESLGELVQRRNSSMLPQLLCDLLLGQSQVRTHRAHQ